MRKRSIVWSGAGAVVGLEASTSILFILASNSASLFFKPVSSCGCWAGSGRVKGCGLGGGTPPVRLSGALRKEKTEPPLRLSIISSGFFLLLSINTVEKSFAVNSPQGILKRISLRHLPRHNIKDIPARENAASLSLILPPRRVLRPGASDSPLFHPLPRQAGRLLFPARQP